MPDIPVRALLPISDVEDTLSCCHSTVYALIKSGQLKSIKLGKRRYVSQKQLADFVASLEAQSTLEDAASLEGDAALGDAVALEHAPIRGVLAVESEVVEASLEGDA